MDILCTTTTTQRVVWFILVYRPPLTMCLPSTNHTTLKRGESAICVFGIRGMFIDLSSDCCIMRPRGLVPDGVPQGAAFGHSRRSCCVMACDGQSTPRRTSGGQVWSAGFSCMPCHVWMPRLFLVVTMTQTQAERLADEPPMSVPSDLWVHKAKGAEPPVSHL